ncbi:PTS fructose transporter subunit IIC [Alicyclobacillus macrosporangiidus]|uniref:PTS system, fructose-specific IIC component n=1 Tax=Alicyclobacillus macrosporangiidus TaxID=392015 RepID=A0A1I7GJL7_9BACL|nr:fructose-specific PTS transporter subunit EIIC [Alicyclobacillus macrosporangiidus]SFU48609.1 PTS system, fructose-specific IIC component [Alicyclobacillus macrosporangiidus]
MKRIVAVTACPTGIAHTYMAQEALQQAAKQMGFDIKVETQGAAGVENRLTDEDIAAADAVIIAADKKVDLDRFAGKRLLETSVSSAIKDAKGLIEASLAQPVFGAGGAGSNAAQFAGQASADYLARVQQGKAEKKAQMPAVYRHLMNGVSHMLPLVVAGGIFIALSFAIDIENKAPLAQAFMNIGGGSAFALFVPILSAYIAMSIADRPGLAPGLVGGWIGTQGAMYGHQGASAGYLGGILAGFLAGYVTKWLRDAIRLPRTLEGIKPVLLLPVLSVGIVGLLMIYVIGRPVAWLMQAMTNGLAHMGATGSAGLGLLLGAMMAFDMGGPVNKVAYFFAAGLVATHTPVAETIMAAVMGAGMTPPLGLALATFLNGRKFYREERDAGKAALILGLCFITEGAIPFASNDPLRVIPSIIAGSAVTGALTMLFHSTLPAPHGGVFVFPLMGNLGLYCVAIVIGTVITALLTLALKRRVDNVEGQEA